jgi:endonuclease/exonuclease/phosphatase family metal-dependent hydrolase
MRPFVKTNKSDYKDSRLSVFMNDYLQNYDLITLQELFSLGSGRTSTLIKEGKKQGFAYNVTLRGSWRKLKPIDSGLIILSRFPIIERDAMIFSRGTDIDGWANKGALSALIDVPINDEKTEHLKMLIITTHLQAEYDVKNPLYLEIQIEQLRELRKFVDKKHKQFPNAPIVLCGDFNINARTTPDIDSLDASSSYLKLVELLSIGERKLHELVSEKIGYHPVTFGDAKLEEKTGNLVPKDTILTHPACLTDRSRLDYIFYYPHLEQQASTEGAGTNSIHIGGDHHNTMLTISEARVEPFYVTGYPFTQLSDHLGVSATFTITTELKFNDLCDIIEEQPAVASPLEQPKEIFQDSYTLRLESDTAE